VRPSPVSYTEAGFIYRLYNEMIAIIATSDGEAWISRS